MSTTTPQPLPPYLTAARPVPADARKPWYRTTAPSYVGLFVWIVYYEAFGLSLPFGGIGGALLGVALTALLSFALFYGVFARIGQQTGLPLYVVGSSTFGAKGGQIIPGVFMGILQMGWFSVMVYFAARLILLSLGKPPLTPFDADPALHGFSLPFLIIAVVWGYTFATIGALGVDAISKVGQWFSIVPLAMLVIAAIAAFPHLSEFQRCATCSGPLAFHPMPLAGAFLIVQLGVGNISTAGTAAVDFGQTNRNGRDVILGGLFGMIIPILVAGSLGIVTMAAAYAIQPVLGTYAYSQALPVVSPGLAPVMLLLFAASAVPSSGMCSFIMGNSLSTMIPRVPRLTWNLIGGTVGIALAVLGLAGNLESFFGLIGASFGPVAGAMTADWLINGRQWAGPRRGFNPPGWIAWALGFAVGVLNNDLIGSPLPSYHPTVLYSYAVGFVVYAVLAKLGLQSESVEMPAAAGES